MEGIERKVETLKYVSSTDRRVGVNVTKRSDKKDIGRDRNVSVSELLSVLDEPRFLETDTGIQPNPAWKRLQVLIAEVEENE